MPPSTIDVGSTRDRGDDRGRTSALDGEHTLECFLGGAKTPLCEAQAAHEVLPSPAAERTHCGGRSSAAAGSDDDSSDDMQSAAARREAPREAPREVPHEAPRKAPGEAIAQRRQLSRVHSL